MEEVKFNLQEENDNNINSLNKTPVSFIQEYAIRRKLCPRYDLIYNGHRQVPTKFIYRLELFGYEVLGEGKSKKQAKHATAEKLFEKLTVDQQDLLEKEFKELNIKNVVSPFEKIITENVIGKLHDICLKLRIDLPRFGEVRKEGKDHVKLYTVNCRIGNIYEEATHTTKKQAKQLAAQQMVTRISTINKTYFTLPKSTSIPDDNTEEKCMKVKNNASVEEDVSNYHLLLNQTEFPCTETLDQLLQQYKSDGQLNLNNPLDVLKKVVEECKMTLSKTMIEKNCEYFCILSITSVYPPLNGFKKNCIRSFAEKDAAKDLLTNMCIMYT